MEEKRVNALLEAEPFNEISSYEDIVQKLPSIYDSAVANTRLSLDRNVIRRVVKPDPPGGQGRILWNGDHLYNGESGCL